MLRALIVLVLACVPVSAQSSMIVALTRILGAGATTGQLVRFNGYVWAGWTPPTTSFTAQTSVTFTHNLGRSNANVNCYRTSDHAEILPKAVATVSVNVVTVTFDSAQSATCAAQ